MVTTLTYAWRGTTRRGCAHRTTSRRQGVAASGDTERQRSVTTSPGETAQHPKDMTRTPLHPLLAFGIVSPLDQRQL